MVIDGLIPEMVSLQFLHNGKTEIVTDMEIILEGLLRMDASLFLAPLPVIDMAV